MPPGQVFRIAYLVAFLEVSSIRVCTQNSLTIVLQFLNERKMRICIHLFDKALLMSDKKQEQFHSINLMDQLYSTQETIKSKNLISQQEYQELMRQQDQASRLSSKMQCKTTLFSRSMNTRQDHNFSGSINQTTTLRGQQKIYRPLIN